MRTFLAFFKKDLLEQIRTGKALILGALFVVFGIMNPAIAKLTPWLLEMMESSLSQSGMSITALEVGALDSWMQFYKNIPVALIAFVLLQSSIFTKEYQSGTLILSLSKGLGRIKVLLSKTLVLILFWSFGYWLCFGITYGYTAYFWDHSTVSHIGFSALCYYLFGVCTLSLTVLFSTVSKSNTGVLLGTGGVVLVFSLVGLIPKVGKYLPTHLCDVTALITGASDGRQYLASILITAVLTVLCFLANIPIFNRKQL